MKTNRVKATGGLRSRIHHPQYAASTKLCWLHRNYVYIVSPCAQHFIPLELDPTELSACVASIHYMLANDMAVARALNLFVANTFSLLHARRHILYIGKTLGIRQNTCIATHTTLAAHIFRVTWPKYRLHLCVYIFKFGARGRH